MKTKSTSIIYSEHFYPWFLPLTFFLPCFWKYGVVIEQEPESITFGYGVFGPTEKSVCSHTTYLRNIEKSSVKTGYATGKDNLFQFGGWGIRYNEKTWAYNASFRGHYVEFIERCGDKTTKYRVVTESPEAITSIIRDGTGILGKDTANHKGQQ
eukprot:scaffold145458_cov77-Cyclotella_meneghiniana.AAC.1